MAPSRLSLGRGVVYTPTHNAEYSVTGSLPPQLASLRRAMHEDLRVLSKYFTHIRTLRAQYFGIEIAPIAATYGLKVYLGLAMNVWAPATQREVRAVETALRDHYPGTVEAVVVGDETARPFEGHTTWCEQYEQVLTPMLQEITAIRGRLETADPRAPRVPFGTFGTFTPLVDMREHAPGNHSNSSSSSAPSHHCAQLVRHLTQLDFLGVSIDYLPVDDGLDLPAFFTAQWHHTVSALAVLNLHKPLVLGTFAIDHLTSPSRIDTAREAYERLMQWRPADAPAPRVVFWDRAFPVWDRPLSHFPSRGGFLSLDRERYVPGIPRPLEAHEDPITGVAPTPRPSHCPLGKYQQVISANWQYAVLCTSSGYNFFNPIKFDELSIQSACANPFCHLIVQELRPMATVEDPECPFD